jgi:hypothetical protein
MDRDAKDLLAEVIDGLIATDRQVGDLAAALVALRLTLAEMGVDFEKRYAKHYEGPEVQQVIRSNAASRDVLLQIARTLRGQA